MDKKQDYESHNKFVRIFSYVTIAASLVIIGIVGTVFYKIYKNNLELRETMERIIETHEETTIVSSDYTYTDVLVQDDTTDGSDGKVVSEFPSSK